MSESSQTQTHREVQRYYGETLASSEDLRTTACCTAAAPPDYARALIANVHPEVLERYYGCGLVLPEAMTGKRVLDLGCGAGRDVYVLSQLVGESGSVVGVDMTPKQLDVARRHRDWHAERFGYRRSNVEFLEGNIEALDALALADGSFDLIVSNCVINLAVDKAAVLGSAHRLLAPGGEMYFSDIYADRRMPDALRSDPVLYGECLAGALYWNDFIGLAANCGFVAPRLLDAESVEVTDDALRARVGDIRFCSATFRLFRLEGGEAGEEDYGQCARYLGSIEGAPQEFRLADGVVFPAGEAVPVSGNTARILAQSRFSAHFEVMGDDRAHLGAFGDKGVPAQFPVAAPAAACCG